MNTWKAELPVIKENRVKLADFGGVGDGLTSNTAAFEKAIKALVDQGGGHLVVTPGVWLTGPICLRSGIDLHLEEGALILFDKNKEEYPLYISDYEGMKAIRARSPIWAEGERDISITGSGVIDGNGHLWRVAKQFKFTPKEWEARLASSPDTWYEGDEGQIWFPTRSAFEGARRQEPDLNEIGEEAALLEAAPYYDYYRPCMVNLFHCERVLLEGVTFKNSPAWNVHPLFCQDITIRKVFIHNDAYAQNGDGLDLESCCRALIEDTVFDVGDDAICIKSGKNAVARKTPGPTKQVLIRNCKVLRGHGGFVIGSEMSRGVRDVDVENCTFMGTDIGLRFKSALGRGGLVENIRIKNIQMLNIPGEAILFNMGYSLCKLSKDRRMDGYMTCKEDIPEFRNFHISGVTAHNAEAGIKIQGLAEMPIHDITIEDSTFLCRKAAMLKDGENIFLKNVRFVNAETKEGLFVEQKNLTEDLTFDN